GECDDLRAAAEMLVEDDRRLLSIGGQIKQAVASLVEEPGWIELIESRLTEKGLIIGARKRAAEILVGELLLVTKDGDSLGPGKERQGLIWITLRRLVEDDHVEEVGVKREDAARLLWPHDP